VIGLLIYAQMADLVTMLFVASAVGIEGEYGFLADAIYPDYGLFGIAVVKIGYVAAYALIAHFYRRTNNTVCGFMAGFGFAFGTIGAIVNVASLAVSV